jgi:hypothetical protein
MRTQEQTMSWFTLPGFWKGFLVGGIFVPTLIIVIEMLIKYIMHGKIFWK